MDRTQADDDSTVALLQDLRKRAQAGEDFATLARTYSEDKETAPIGGSLGTAEVAQLDKNFAPTVASLASGDISEPVRLTVGSSYGYHIVMLKRRTAPHTPTLDEDYPRIEAIALNFKRNRDYQSWLEELRTQIYWESRL